MIITKTVALKVGQKVVTISMEASSKPNSQFFIHNSIYELHVTDVDEVREDQRNLITSNLDLFVKDLKNESISDLVDDRVDAIFAGDVKKGNTIGQTLGDDSLVEICFVNSGQNFDEILRLLSDNEDIKQLVKLGEAYQLHDNVDHLIVDQVNDIFDRLDNGKDKYDLAEEVLEDYATAL